MKKKFSFLLVIVFMASYFFCGCYELSASGVDYVENFDTHCSAITYSMDDLKSLDEYKISMDTFLMDEDSTKFYTDDISSYEYDAYKYIVVDIVQDCIIDQVCLYAKYDSGGSGENASSSLGVQVFQKSGFSFDDDFIEDSAENIYNGSASESDLYKVNNDSSLTLKNGAWNDGTLISFTKMYLSDGDQFIIKFVENCDFDVTVEKDDEGNETGYTYTEKSDNNVSFKFDKMLFHVVGE